MEISIDFETRSVVDLKQTGVYPYAADATTEILCMAYAPTDSTTEPFLWVPGEPVPLVFESLSVDTFRAWNAAFERIIWQEILAPRYGFPELEMEQWYCTMAEASAMALPRGLANAAAVLGVKHQKFDTAHMLRMARPRRPRVSQGEDPNGIYFFDDPERLDRLYQYCRQDVRVERACAAKVRRLSPHERELYLLDQRINDRGIGLDIPLVTAAQKIRARAVEEANHELDLLTQGRVRSVVDSRSFRSYLEMDSVSEDAVAEALRGQLSDHTRRVLQLRRDHAKASVAKLDKMQAVALGGRAHGLLQYHGADTGRWAGRLIQPQNFPRPTLKDIEEYIPLVMAGDYDGIQERCHPMEVLSSMLRSMLIPSPGHTFYCGDFKAIEGWVIAWLAGQEGMTSYEEMASHIFGIPAEEVGEESEERQVGKVAVLGCGFGMGPSKYKATVKSWTGLEISDELAEHAVSTYRTVNHSIQRLWWRLEEAAVQAVKQSGSIQMVGRVRYRVKGKYLWCVLPSGRPLCYPKPWIVPYVWGHVNGIVQKHPARPTKNHKWPEGFVPDGTPEDAVEISTTNAFTRKWERRSLYGGLLAENITQAVARDIMADAMFRTDRAGYPIVLTVHDEILAESSSGDLDHFLSLMREMPEWADRLQLEVSGWEGERFRK